VTVPAYPPVIFRFLVQTQIPASGLWRALPINAQLKELLMLYKSARGLMAWFTLFFIWSAFVLWYHGVGLLQFIMHDSNLYSFSLALRQTRSDMLPDALPVVLLIMLVLAVGAFLSSVTVAMINAVAFLFRTTGALIQAQFSHHNPSSFH